MINPVMCWCPICGVVISLPECNRINLLSTHIASFHPTKTNVTEICLKLEQPQFNRKFDTKIQVRRIADKHLSEQKKQLPSCLGIPENTHYLSYWFNHILNQEIIEPTHITFQEVDALMEIILRYPNPTPNRLGWRTWPTLAAYVQKIGASFSRHAVKLYLGSHKVTDNSLQGLKNFVASVNHAGPSLSTVDSWKPPLQLVSGPNHLTTLLHLHILMKSKDSPCISNERVTRFPGVLVYDEQEINQGVFPVEIDGKINLVGFSKLISVDDIEPEKLSSQMRTDHSYKMISAARAFRFADFGDYFSSANYISYIAGAEKHPEIALNLEEAIKWITSCKNCLEKGKK